ncbi:MAG: hypothetical protein KC519_19340, partial [Anaerolineae bacterium]|nr:hypothetical protein [Anaerolineae bacterium]
PLGLFVIAIPILVGFAAFGLAVYRATMTFRAEFTADLRQVPKRFSGPMPERLNRIPPLAMIGMEVVGALFGWPGVGWLFAGQTMVAVAMLMIGPAIAWALLPMLFSPFTDTALSQLNWYTLLIWLPASALVSSAVLGAVLWRRQHAQQPASKPLVSAANATSAEPGEARAPRPARRRIPRGVALGVAVIVLFLLSVPILPFFMGITDGTPQYTLMPELLERSSGAYLQVDDGQQHGLMKLFVWNFPLDEAPVDSPVLNPDFVQEIVISQRGLDNADRYQLFHVHGSSDHRIPLLALPDDSGRQLALTPGEALQPGDYMLSIPVDGMFAGREYYYFRLDPSVTALPVVAPETATSETVATDQQPTESAVWLEVFPLTAAGISLLMVWTMIGRLRKKFRAYEAAWAVAFGMFAVAAGTQVWGDLVGWTATLARLYYVLGATLVVGWLGLGTWLLLARKSWLQQLGLWIVLLLTGLGFGLVMLTPVNSSLLAAEGWHALEKPAALTIVTIATNTLGTLILVGGALWSAWSFWRQRVMRQRMYGLILIAAGALGVAAGGSLTRLGHQQYLYIAMSLGMGLIFWGYLKTIQPPVPAQNSGAESTPRSAGSNLAADTA